MERQRKEARTRPCIRSETRRIVSVVFDGVIRVGGNFSPSADRLFLVRTAGPRLTARWGMRTEVKLLQSIERCGEHVQKL